jgi:hypothetical protein
MNASPECWQLYGDVEGFEMSDPGLAARFHQLAVDAYGAQHAGGDTGYIRVAYSLVGLYLALERGLTGVQVRDAHQRLGRPDPTWPSFPRPAFSGAVTIVDVAEAGLRGASFEGHEEAVAAWASSVWSAWANEHDAVARLTARLLPAFA